MGYVGTTYNSSTGKYEFLLNGFDQYLTPIYSERNATSYVIYELTDYIDSIKKSYFKNTFTVTAYDYALNQATYQIELPDEYLDFFFTETEITLSPNELYDLAPLVYPNTEWAEFIEYESNRPDIARVVGGKILAVKSGACAITAKATLKDGTVTFHHQAKFVARHKQFHPVATFHLKGHKICGRGVRHVIFGTMAGHIGALGYHSCIHCQSGRVIIFVPLEDTPRCLHKGQREYCKKHYKKQD